MNWTLEPFITLIFHVEEIGLDFDQCVTSPIIYGSCWLSVIHPSSPECLYAESRLEEEEQNNLGISFFNSRYENRLSYISAGHTADRGC